MVKLCQEPFIDLGQAPDTIDGVPSLVSRGDREHAFIGGVSQLLIDIFREIILWCNCIRPHMMVDSI